MTARRRSVKRRRPRKAAKRRRGRRRRKKPPVDPRTKVRAFEVLNFMRSKGFSLTRAAREAHTTPATVRKYVGSALKRSPGGRYSPTPSDRLTRHLYFLTKTGKVEIAVRGSRPASRVARHMAAVHLYLSTGDTSALAEFKGKKIRSRNQTYVFLTNTKVLDRLARAGEVSFERLYAGSA